MPSFIYCVQGREVLFKFLGGFIEIAKPLLSIDNILPDLIVENTNSGHGRDRNKKQLLSLSHYPSYTSLIQSAWRDCVDLEVEQKGGAASLNPINKHFGYFTRFLITCEES